MPPEDTGQTETQTDQTPHRPFDIQGLIAKDAALQAAGGAAGAEPGDAKPDETETITKPAESGEEPKTSPTEDAGGKPAPEETNAARLRAWGESLETDLVALKPVAEKVEELGGIELVGRVVESILGDDFNPTQILDTVHDERGLDNYTKFVVETVEREADWVADYLLRNASELITDPALRQRFLAAPASTSPTRLTSSPSQTAAAPGDEYDYDPDKDYDLPDEVKAEIKEARALRGQLASLRTEVDSLKGYRETEEQRRQREEAEAADRTYAATVNALNLDIFGVAREPLTQMTVSTHPDPAIAEAENLKARKEVYAYAYSEVDLDPALGKLYQKAVEARIKGDKRGAESAVRVLRDRFKTVLVNRIAERTGGLKTAAAAGTSGGATERKVIPGGSAVPAGASQAGGGGTGGDGRRPFDYSGYGAGDYSSPR